MEIVTFFANLEDHISQETERIVAKNNEMECKLNNLEVKKCEFLRQQTMFEAFPAIIDEVRIQSNAYAKTLHAIAEKGNGEQRILLNAWHDYKIQERRISMDKTTTMPFHDVETAFVKLEEQIHQAEANVLEINEISKEECKELHNEYLEINAQVNNVAQCVKEIENDIEKTRK